MSLQPMSGPDRQQTLYIACCEASSTRWNRSPISGDSLLYRAKIKRTGRDTLVRSQEM